MIPVDLVQRIIWTKGSGVRLKALRKGKHSRRSLAEALRAKGVSYTPGAIQQLEEGKTESIDMRVLLDILQAIGSELSALLPTTRINIGLPQ